MTSLILTSGVYNDVTAAPLKELDILVIDMYVELLVCVVLLEPGEC